MNPSINHNFMELRHLRYFVTVAQQGHMTKAAEILGIQQPPLSSQIKDLETELGFQLFNRHSKGMSLSKAGEVFYHSVVDILKDVESAKIQASRTHQGLEGEFVIGVTTSVAAHHLFVNIIRSFRRTYPMVKLKIVENNAEELTPQLISKHLNVVLLRLPVMEREELQSQVLIEESILVALPKDHKLLEKVNGINEPTISLKDLKNEKFILVRKPGSPGIYENLIVDCQSNGFDPYIEAEVENMLTNLNLVAAGVGISVVPASMSCFHQNAVSYLPLYGVKNTTAPITAITHKIEKSLIVSNFIKIAKNESILIES